VRLEDLSTERSLLVLSCDDFSAFCVVRRVVRSTAPLSDLDPEFDVSPDDASVSAAVFSVDLLMIVHGTERVLTARRTSVSVFPDASGDSMRVAVRSLQERSFIRYSRSPFSWTSLDILSGEPSALSSLVLRLRMMKPESVRWRTVAPSSP